MNSYHSIVGKNVITVLLTKPHDSNQLRMFFDPYTRNITTQYQGEVSAILPGYDPNETPQVMIRPQRMEYGFNIQYSFREGKKQSDTVDFYIQDQYFQDVAVKTYFCYNCQAPSLYYSETKVVDYRSKKEVVSGNSFVCINPFCKQSFNYLGMVKLTQVN